MCVVYYAWALMGHTFAMLQVAQFLEKELAFRESVATAINKANTGRRRKRNDVCWNSNESVEFICSPYLPVS